MFERHAMIIMLPTAASRYMLPLPDYALLMFSQQMPLRFRQATPYAMIRDCRPLRFRCHDMMPDTAMPPR